MSSLAAATACLAIAAALVRNGLSVTRQSFVRLRLDGSEPVRPSGPWAVRLRSAWRTCPTTPFAVVAAIVVASAAVFGGPPAAVVAMAAVGAVAVARFAHRLGAGPRYEAAMVDVIDAMARRLRSGADVRTAIRDSLAAAPDPLRGDLDAVQAALGRGELLAAVLDEWRLIRPLPTVGLVAGALAVGAASGGLRAVVVDDLALMLRQRDRARREAVALAGQARASAVVLMAAPVVVAAVLAAGDATARTFLVRSGVGLVCLTAGLGLDLVAALWMVKITIGGAWLR